MKAAVVMSGAMARGPFHAGVLLELVNIPGIEFTSFHGASAGALCAVIMAGATYRGVPEHGAKHLEWAWVEKCGIGTFASANAKDLIKLHGVFDGKAAIDFVESQLETYRSMHPYEKKHVACTLAMCTLNNSETTFHEKTKSFVGSDFEFIGSVKHLSKCAVASAAFPGMFAPIYVDDELKFCVDGGSVDNTPIHHVIDTDKECDVIFVISPNTILTDYNDEGGLTLVERFADILINERRHRDVYQAEKINSAITNLNKFCELYEVNDIVKQQMFAAAGLNGKKVLKIVEITSDEKLPGNAFSGFFSKKIRLNYVNAGRLAARKAIKNYL